MREIKFRAWSPLAKEMYMVNGLSFDKEGLFEISVAVCEVDGITYSSVIARSLELMQFTGTRDIHGKEIYEGDIVQWDGVGLGKIRQSVRYMDERAEFLPNCMHGEVEIIGNIYENPELLRQP